ncbi:MAG: hypothetical protein IAE85_05655 [Anaerolinea sp.]|nr:hypothetical protein [Anaerolinea sp.]
MNHVKKIYFGYFLTPDGSDPVMGVIGHGASARPFTGGVEQWVDELTHLALEVGMDSFILGLPEPPGNQLERFIAEIAPRVREAVAQQTGAGT